MFISFEGFRDSQCSTGFFGTLNFYSDIWLPYPSNMFICHICYDHSSAEMIISKDHIKLQSIFTVPQAVNCTLLISMGRRYYCDYCDRSFTDVIESRKKHLNGVRHERLKKIYYSNARDLKTLVQEERQKDTCRRFRNTGSCPFEEACTFTHYSNQELTAFEREVEEQERKQNELPILPHLQELINKRTVNTSGNIIEAISVYGSNNPLKHYDYRSLPPSLQYMSFEEIDKVQFVNWG